MGRAFDDVDWNLTPLGPIEGWPEALKASINLMLGSPFAMCMAWGPALTFFYNDAYIPMLGKRHGGVLGQPIKDVWWDVWDAIAPWVDTAMGGGVVHLEDTHLVMQRNGFEEETYWTFAYSPLADGDGTIHGFIDVCIETTAKVLSERRVAEEQSRVRQLFDEAPNFMALLVGPEHRFELVNSGYRKLIGDRDVVGKTVGEMLGDAVAQGHLGLLDAVYRTGQTFVGTNARYRVQAVPGGPVDERYVDFVYQALKDETGKPYGVFINGIDVTDRKHADDARDVLHRELVHRVKNTMAVTTAVVSASMRHASSLEEARETIGARIEALSRSQAFLAGPGNDAPVEALVREALAPHVSRPEQLVMSGPRVVVTGQQAVGLSLAVYELATNAVKYGALSTPGGRIEISWADGEDRSFQFHWRESGGPLVSTPTRYGFGSRLTNRIVAAYFGGTAETQYAPGGVEFALQGTLSADDAPASDGPAFP